jgi:hypothetical protein
MNSWSQAQLRAIADNDDLFVSPFREDGNHVRHADPDLGCHRRR